MKVTAVQLPRLRLLAEAFHADADAVVEEVEELNEGNLPSAVDEVFVNALGPTTYTQVGDEPNDFRYGDFTAFEKLGEVVVGPDDPLKTSVGLMMVRIMRDDCSDAELDQALKLWNETEEPFKPENGFSPDEDLAGSPVVNFDGDSSFSILSVNSAA